MAEWRRTGQRAELDRFDADAVRSFSDYLLAFMTSGLASLLPGRRAQPGGGAQTRRQRGDRAEERGRRPEHLWLGGRHASRSALC